MPPVVGTVLDKQYRRALQFEPQRLLPGVLEGQGRVYAGPGQVPTYDWQNALPPRGRPAGPVENRSLFESLVTSTLVGQDTIYGRPGMASDYEWTVPRGYVSPLSLRTHTNADVLDTLRGQDTLYADPGQAPVYEWTVPRGAVPALSLRTHLNADVNDVLAGQDRFYAAPGQSPVYDWQNALPPRGAAPRERPLTFTQMHLADTLRGQDTFYGAPGQSPVYDWPLPVPPRPPRPSFWEQPLNLLGTLLGIAPGALPVGVRGLIWPDAPAVPFLLRLRASFVALRAQDDVEGAPVSGVLSGQDTIYGAPGQAAAYDWQLPPKAPLPRQDNRTWLHNLLRFVTGNDTVYGAPGQSPGYDWPNPRAYPPRPTRRDDPNLVANLFTTPPEVQPEGLRGHVWPDAIILPLLKTLRVALRAQDEVTPSRPGLTLAGQDTFYGAPGQVRAVDQPLPPTLPKRGPLFEVWQQLLNVVLGGVSLPPGETTQPETLRAQATLRAAVRAQADVQPATPLLTLKGQDTVYGTQGQVPTYEHQIALPPKAAPRSSTLRGHVDDGNARRLLAGQDRLYGAPGQVPVYDWQTALPPIGTLPRARAVLRGLWEVVGNGWNTFFNPPPPVFRGRVRAGDALRASLEAGDAARGGISTGDGLANDVRAGDD